MESRIVDILNRMNEENRKLQKYRNEYLQCQKLKNTNIITLCTNVLLKHPTFLNEFRREYIQMTIEGDVISKIIDLLEEHFAELGEQCKKNLEDMVEEMKTPH